MRRVAPFSLLVALVAGAVWLTPQVSGAAGDTTLPDDTSIATNAADTTIAVESTPVPASRGTTVQQVPTLPPPSTVPENSGTGRRAVYDLSEQRVWVVDAAGEVVRMFRVSGRLNQPDPGTYKVFSKSEYTCSIHDWSICMRFMIRFTVGPKGGNIGFHEIPMQYGVPLQTLEQLGQPISDGCLREAPVDAEFMWYWADVGTKVVVLA